MTSRQLTKQSRTGIATVSVVALALGAFAVVGPGPNTTTASAQESLTGGIRAADGSGVINTGDQMASDLGAGSCMVASDFGSEDGSQAGFSWVRVEPSNNTDDKRTWGVSVAFDNSKDRTFAYWEWSSSSRNPTPVTFGSVQAAPAGTTLGTSVTASDQADEQLGIYRGSQITYGLQSDLTQEKVAQFAQAGADSPVRYVWKTKYTQNNPTGIKATENSSFIALVNPWPSENDQCAPIEVTWEGIQEHVIVPGEETKVGHIDVPELSNGSFDKASLSRMVVEAYDGNGKYIASSDTSASNGGKQLLRVDDNGDIYYTWPEYRGTELAAQQNVQFSVVAKPRTTSQLEAVYQLDDFYGPSAKVFDTSNSLPRYSTANEIGRNTISLDDTEFHDPQYNTDEQTITSGIDKDGNLTNKPQKVVFEQVPDLIRDLVKKKGDGGFEAKVVLDQRYVFAGWKAEMDDDYNVTVTAPADAEPGTFAQPRVVVEYSNGSKDELSLLVIVDPNHTQITDLVRPAVAKGEVNKEITSQITTKSIMNGYDPVSPATFEVDQSTVPAGWTVTVDNTGKVTATADDTVLPGTIISPKVTATYPDGTIDEIEPQFQAIVDIKIPDYDTVTNKPGTEVSLTPKVPEVGLTGNASDEAPTRYTFKDEKTELTIDDEAGTWTVKIDETTGKITTTIPRTAPEGHILEIPVLAYYSDEKPQQVKGTVVVLKGDIAPVYSVESTGPNQAVDHQVQDAPVGSTFSFGKNPNGTPITEMTTEDGWKYTIDPKTGVVTSTPPAGSKPGDKKTITVDVLTPTGATPKVPVTTVVQLTDNWEAEPNYPSETVYPGDTATLPITLQKPDNVNVAKYELGAVPDGWTVSIDNDGKITATAPADAEPGSKVEIPVTVTYEDGSTDTATAVVNVVDVPTRPVPFGVEYVYDDTIPAGKYKTVTKGEAGEEKQQRDGTWEQTTAPTNEVVHVGTKPAEASKDVTWTAPIPYSTTTRPNRALAPGETKVVQQGVNGERTYTAKFTATGDQASVVESEDTKQPVEEIIEYGPRLDDQELVTETTRKIPFETTIVYDNTLEADTQVVDTQGVVGEETVTSTQKLVDGKPSGDPEVVTTTVTPKQDAVIRVGTKTEGANTVEHTEPVPYETKVEYDPNTPAGTYKVVTPGKAGEKTVKVTQTIVNSQVTDTKREENVTTQPVTEVIKVGTKQATATDKVEWTEPIPFSTVVRPNPDLKPGEVKTVQEGKNGEAKYTATFEGTNGQATVTESKDRTEPTDRIIEYGPTIDDQTLTSTTTNPVPFNTTFVADPTLPAGEQVVDKQGENGVDTVTATQEIKDGKPVGEPTITTERTKEPVNAVVRVGTKTEGQTVNTYEAAIPFPVRVVYDPNLAPGESKVTQEGKPGTKKVTITQPVVNSAPNGEATVAEETVTEPTEQIVTVGTKPDEATNTATWTVDVPFKTVVRANPDLKPGEVKTVQEGEYGEKKFTADFSSVGSGSKVETKEEQTKEPKEQIIEYGPTIDDQTLKSETTRPIEFVTEFVLDESLPAGEQKVDQQGENGEEKITSTQEIKDGKPVGKPKITTETTKEPTKAIIRVGTKPTTTTATTTATATTTEKSTATETTRVEVPTTITTTLTTTEKTTTTVEGKPTTLTTTKEVPTTITTKVPTTVPTTVEKTTTEKSTATETTRVEVPTTITTTLTSTREIPTTVEGKPTTTTVTTEVPTTITTTVPTTVPTTVKETETATTTTTVPAEPKPVSETVKLPFTTKIIFDDTLESGQEVEDVKGVDGEVKVTFENGKATAETVKEPVQRVVRVGSKPADGVEWTEETPYTVKVEEDPNLEAGKYVVAQEGKPGQTVHKTDGTVETTEPTDHIIKVGTKNADSVKSTFKAPIPAPVEIVYDPNLPAGTTEVANEGKDGEKEVTVTRKMVNGQPTGEPQVTEKVTTEPQPRIIKVGTKQPEAGENVTWTEPIPFTTEFRENPDLKPGETKVVQEGKDGEATYTIEFKANGESATVENTNQRVEPVNRIIEYGPRADDDEISSQVTRPIEFKTSVIYDDTLEEGKQEITQGELGEEVVTTTQKLVDGKPSGEPVTTTQQTKAPKNAVIRIGTKKPGAPTTTPAPEVSETVELPFTTKIVFDPTLEPGTEVEDVAGVNGQVKVTVVDGKATVETVKEPVQRVVRVGTKPAENVEYTEELPFKVEVQEDPNLEAGKHEVVQTGVAGKVIHKADGTEERTEPVNHVIKVGTKCKACEAPKPSEPTTPPSSKPDQPTPPAPEDGSSAKAKATIDRCFGNAVRSPILWLLPIGILGAVGGKVLEPHMAAINQQFGEFNAEINRRVQESMPDFGFGGHGGNNEQINQLMAQVDAANRQLQALAGDPNVQMIGKVIGAVAALAAISGVLYDWCSADVGKAKTAIDFGEGSSSRR